MNALLRSTLHGSLGLGLVSLMAYSVWAFVPRIAGSEVGMYALIALVYLLGSGFALCGLLQGETGSNAFTPCSCPRLAVTPCCGAWRGF